MMVDITVVINFHREGAFAIPALASMMDLIFTAREEGLRVESRATLDKVDDLRERLYRFVVGFLMPWMKSRSVTSASLQSRCHVCTRRVSSFFGWR